MASECYLWHDLEGAYVRLLKCQLVSLDITLSTAQSKPLDFKDPRFAT